MEYLERIAAQEFLDLCRISYFEGIIGRYEFMSRMRAVLSLAEPNSGVFRYAKKLIEQENWEAECKWDRWRQGDGRGFEGDDIRSQEADDQSSIFYFVSKSTMGFSRKWVFHKGDADPDPSVPHGHDYNDDRRKLHAYRGFVYFQGEPDGREPRDAIVRLWNNPGFRIFAYEAIKHFVNARPDWVWDRNPLTLPTVRRGY